MQAMILAAGFGTRLQPYTNIRPKPLFPLLNTPLLLLTIRRLQDAGFNHIVVNCHHLAEQVHSLVVDMPGVYLQQEDRIMGTGGGLRLALDMLAEEPLLVTNGDIYHTVDYMRLYNEHVNSGSGITLAVHDYPRFNGLDIEGDRLLGFNKKAEGDAVAFTGIHVLDPALLRPLSADHKSGIIEWYKELMWKGEEIKVIRVDGCYWTDMGTPADYLQLHGDVLTGRVQCWQQVVQKIESPMHIDRRAYCGKNLVMNDWACIGRARIGNDVTVSRSVIWDGAVIPDNSVITDSILV